MKRFKEAIPGDVFVTKNSRLFVKHSNFITGPVDTTFIHGAAGWAWPVESINGSPRFGKLVAVMNEHEIIGLDLPFLAALAKKLVNDTAYTLKSLRAAGVVSDPVD